MTKSSETRIKRRLEARSFGPVGEVKPGTESRKCIGARLAYPDDENSTKIRYLHVTRGVRIRESVTPNHNAWRRVMQRAMKHRAAKQQTA